MATLRMRPGTEEERTESAEQTVGQRQSGPPATTTQNDELLLEHKILCDHRSHATRTGETEPSASVRCTQDAVLLEQVLNDRLLLPVDPAGEDENDEGKRRRQRVHGASVPDKLASRKDVSDFAIVRHGFGPSSRATRLLRLRRIGLLSSDPASAEFSHRTGLLSLATGRLR